MLLLLFLLLLSHGLTRRAGILELGWVGYRERQGLQGSGLVAGSDLCTRVIVPGLRRVLLLLGGGGGAEPIVCPRNHGRLTAFHADAYMRRSSHLGLRDTDRKKGKR